MSPVPRKLFFSLQSTSLRVTQACGWCGSRQPGAQRKSWQSLCTRQRCSLIPRARLLLLGAEKAKAKVVRRLTLRGTGSGPGQTTAGHKLCPGSTRSFRVLRAQLDTRAKEHFSVPRTCPGQGKAERVRDLGDARPLPVVGWGLLSSPSQAPSSLRYFLCHPLWTKGIAPDPGFLRQKNRGTKTEVRAAEVAGCVCGAQPGSRPGRQVSPVQEREVAIHEQITSQGVHEFLLASRGGVLTIKAGRRLGTPGRSE